MIYHLNIFAKVFQFSILYYDDKSSPYNSRYPTASLPDIFAQTRWIDTFAILANFYGFAYAFIFFGPGL